MVTCPRPCTQLLLATQNLQFVLAATMDGELLSHGGM